ncbi:hypothetical protein MBANPS3_007259 [Mucor bainieri]
MPYLNVIIQNTSTLQAMDTHRSLPAELLLMIFGHLDSSKTIGECRLVCKAWDEPAAISVLGRPINVQNRLLAENLVEYLESHPNKGQYIRHLTVDRYLDNLLDTLLQQAFTPNIEELGVGGFGFARSGHFDALYKLMINLAKRSNVKFSKLKKIPYFDDVTSYAIEAPSKSYQKALWTFRESLESIKLSFNDTAEVEDLVYRFNEFKKLTELDLQGEFDTLEDLETILVGCPHLKKLDLIANNFVLWEGQQWDDVDFLDRREMLAWAKENVEQLNSVKTLIISTMGNPNFIEYWMYKCPKTTKFVFDTFREESGYESDSGLFNENIARIVDTVKHIKSYELHYQIPPGESLQEVCRLTQGNKKNSMLIRYNVMGAQDTIHMHLTNTRSKNGTCSATFDLEMPNNANYFGHGSLIEDAGIPIHSLELDFLNFSREKGDLLYDSQLPMNEESEELFSILYNALDIHQLKVLARFIDGPADVFGEEEDVILLESLEFCSAQVTEYALESIAQDCQMLGVLTLTNCQLVPGDDNIYHIKMHSTHFHKFKLHTVPMTEVIRHHDNAAFDHDSTDYEHVKDYVRDALQNIEDTWSEPCYLWISVGALGKKIFFKIVPGNRNAKRISKKAFDARSKDAFVLHLSCYIVNSLEINIGESYLSLDSKAIMTALRSRLACALDQDDGMVEATD